MHQWETDSLYILTRYDRTAVVFDLDERFSFVENFSPFGNYPDYSQENCGLAGDLDNKRMYLLGEKEGEKHLGVYDERANKWDMRKLDWKFSHWGGRR